MVKDLDREETGQQISMRNFLVLQNLESDFEYLSPLRCYTPSKWTLFFGSFCVFLLICSTIEQLGVEQIC